LRPHAEHVPGHRLAGDEPVQQLVAHALARSSRNGAHAKWRNLRSRKCSAASRPIRSFSASTGGNPSSWRAKESSTAGTPEDRMNSCQVSAVTDKRDDAGARQPSGILPV
jgi:hypothetical protein